MSPATRRFERVCALTEILPGTAVAAWVGGRAIAIFRLPDERLYAIDAVDPFSGATVLWRGIVGGLEGEPVVASPLYKQHFSLSTGRCLEAPQRSVDAFPVERRGDAVWVQAKPKRSFRPPPPSDPDIPSSLVVVGNGMAAMRTIEALLERAPGRYRITVFGAERHGNYNRIQLSPLLAGSRTADQIMLHRPDWYREHDIAIHLGDPVVEIDRRHRRVRAESGLEVHYDRLLIATGSQPFIPPIAGVELAGVRAFRNLDDVAFLQACAAAGGQAVVIGGGLLGLEAACGLQQQGMQVTVVHLMPRLMERQLDDRAAALLQGVIEARGIRVCLSASTEALDGESGRVRQVRLADGRSLAADLVVMAAGIRPDTALAARAGLPCGRGIRVNDTLQTFDPRIYAVGECVEHRGQVYGLVAPLYEQAAICAAHLAGDGRGSYRGSATSTQLKVSGVDVFSAGDISGGDGVEDLVLEDPRSGLYKRLLLRDDRVVGAVLFGDTDDGPWYFDLIRAGTDIREQRANLLFGSSTTTAEAA